MNKWVKTGVGVCLSLVGLLYAFYRIEWLEFWKFISNANIILILGSAFIIIFSVYIRAVRWRFLIIQGQEIKVYTLFKSCMIGYFGNSVLPFRLGELLRGYALKTSSSLAMPTIIGTIVLERVIDMVGLTFFIMIFLFLFPLAEWTGWLIYVIIGLTLLVFLLILNLKKENVAVNKVISAASNSHRPIMQKLAQVITGILEGLSGLRNTQHGILIIATTALLWGLYYVSMGMVVIAMNLSIGWIGAGILLIATTLSILIPAAPGYIGTYHAVIVFVLMNLFDSTKVESQGFAVLAHAVGFIPFVIFGAIYFINSSVKFSFLEKSGLSK